MDIIERINEERFVESLICLWIQPDAPEWIIDYVRTELRKQRGLLEEKDLKAMEKVNGTDGDNVRFNVCELNHNKVQSDDWFCADGVKRE